MLNYLATYLVKEYALKAAAYALGGVLFLGITYYSGYSSGAEKVREEYRKNQARLEKQVKNYKKQFEESQGMLEKREDQIRELEDKFDEKAASTPGNPLCITPDGLRRLNKGIRNR